MQRLAALALTLAVSFAAHGATFVVNSTGDAADASAGNGVCATSGGVCTLRAAIQEANALAGTDTITFVIGSGPQTIAPASDLPAITTPLTIDATTQPGSGSGPRILLDGANARTVGLDDNNATVTIRGLAIGGFTIAGIRTLQSGDTVTVERCFIGVGLDGVTAMPNGDGIWAKISDLGGSSLLVGNSSGGGNVISGNADMGIELNDNGGAGAKLGTLTVQGNVIGLGSDGLTAVPNLSGGLRTNLQFGTITIGGSAAGRNVISGNNGTGYNTQAFFQADTFIFTDNYVGVAQDGITPRPNKGIGASLVGRAYTVTRNVFAANQSHGLQISTGDQPGTITANKIGVAADGSALGNGGNGIRITSGNGIVIGGAGAAQNVIANNGAAGIVLTNSAEAEIAENSIVNNGGLGIDLGGDGLTANDALDADTQGGNNTQNYPAIVTAVRSGGITFISGSLASAASKTYTIRFYTSSAADPSGFGEGETYLGSTTVTTNASGNANINFSTGLGGVGLFVSATATDFANGDTSEFSNALVISGPPQFSFSAASTTTPESGSVTLTIQRLNGSTGPASVSWTAVAGTATAADYTASTGTATFADGQTTRTISIPITNDTLDEIDESFSVVLSNPSAGTELGSPSTETVTIIDDDTPPAISIAGASAPEGNAGNTPLAFNVTLTGASGKAITVDYTTSNGTATAGSDYAAAAGTLTFNPGETSKQIVVQVIGDTATELNETFGVALSNPVNASLGASTATGTITNDDGPPSITIGDVAVVEGNSGTTTAVFPLTLSGPSGATVTVNWSTSDVTATAGSDYQSASGTVSFPPGTTTATISVNVTGDALVETNETFHVDLSGPTNATLADAQAIGTIADDDGTPSLSINDPAIAEGTAATFTVTLAPASALPVTVSYATSDLTATSSSDYTPASGVLTFAPGETSKTISVATIDDTVAEPSEQFKVTLSAPSGATIGDDTGIATIIDDDGEPRVTIGNVSAAEGNAGASVLTFSVDLSHASATAISVPWTTVDGSATAGSDYVAASGTLTFNPGETSKTIPITINGDSVVEPDETFTLQLTGGPAGVGTIVNDDGGVFVTISDVSQSESTSPFTFNVTLSAASSQSVTVQWATSDGTATAGSDYTAASGSLTFAPGETSKSIAIAVTSDTTFEPNETFFVNLLGASNAAIADPQGLGTILNDDSAPAVPSISIAPASVVEGNSGTASLTFNVTLDVATVNSVTVDYATGGGTATAAADYVATSGTLTFAPGETAKTIAVPVLGDTLVEGNETFIVTLTSPTNASLGTANATGTILDDDSAPAVPSISIANASASEGDSGSTSMSFAVTLDVPTTATVMVQYATSPGSASAGSDYVTTSGTLLFAPGVTTQNVVVPILGDTLVEGNETFAVTLTSPTNATLGTSTATGTIVDDDALPAVPSLTIGDVTQFEGDSGATLFSFPVTLSASSAIPVSVSWSTIAGSAVAGSDFAAANGTLVFAPGMTSQTIVVAVNGDTLVEPDETFSIQLSAPANATLARATAVATIRNDDVAGPAPSPVPTLQAGNVRIIEGNDGLTQASLTLTLSSPAAGGAAVRWITHAGSASGGSDFVEGSGRVTFGTNTTATIPLSIVGDRVAEGDETFSIELFEPVNLVLSQDHVDVTIVDDDRPAAQRAIVLAVGSLRGNAGSRFGTAVQMVNPTADPANGALVIRPAGTNDPARDVTIPYTLGPRELRAWGDLLADNGLSGLATLDVVPAAGALPRMTVRIYDDGGGHGTTGFTLPVVTPDAALAAGDEAVIVAPENPVAMRFNVGIRTLDDGATLAIEVRDRSGATRHTSTRDFLPNWFNQLSGADFAGIALQGGDYLAIRVTKGRAILYGAAVDNVTNDPSVEVVMR